MSDALNLLRETREALWSLLEGELRQATAGGLINSIDAFLAAQPTAPAQPDTADQSLAIRDLAAMCGRLVRRLRETAPDDALAATATRYLTDKRYLSPLRVRAMDASPARSAAMDALADNARELGLDYSTNPAPEV